MRSRFVPLLVALSLVAAVVVLPLAIVKAQTVVTINVDAAASRRPIDPRILAFGIAVIPLCVWFIAVLVAGMRIVHWDNGWFVVGEGRNGIELSVLLVACLVAIALDGWERRKEKAFSRG